MERLQIQPTLLPVVLMPAAVLAQSPEDMADPIDMQLNQPFESKNIGQINFPFRWTVEEKDQTITAVQPDTKAPATISVHLVDTTGFDSKLMNTLQDNIIKSIDGDVAMMYFGDMMFSDSRFLLLSELAHSQWIADVDYWKTSTPKGGEIKDLGKDTYCYTDSQSQYYFGLVGGTKDGQKSTSSQQFFCGNTPNAATSPFEPFGEPIPQAVIEKIKGNRLAVVVNLEKSGGILAMMLKEKFQPLFGDFNTVVYLVES